MPSGSAVRHYTRGVLARISSSVWRILRARAPLALLASLAQVEGDASRVRGALELTRLAPALFEASCVRCHGPEAAENDLRLDQLAWDPADSAALARWQAVLARLEDGQMPPAGEPRPASEDVAALTRALRQALADLSRAPDPRGLRRLTRVQYRNTLRDLLSIDVLLEDPTRDFPVESGPPLAEGQVMSDFLLTEALRAARRALDLAILDGPQPAPVRQVLFDPDARPGDFTLNHTRAQGGQAFLFLDDERTGRGPRGQVLASPQQGVSAAGWYELSLTVESRGRTTPLPALRQVVRPNVQVYRPEDLHRLDLFLALPGPPEDFEERRRVCVESVDLADGEIVTLTRRYWLAAGWRLEAGFGNAFAGALDRYLRALGAEERVKAFADLPYLAMIARLAEISHAEVLRADAPRIVIHAASTSGPHHESWPPPSQRAAFGEPGTPIGARLAAFATRAFRRPVPAEELAPYVRLAEESPAGLRTALEALLCSPRCLYLFEPEGPLDDWALAARLSYFLWCTLPDEELRALAAEGRLRDPDVLRAQALRLLDDARVLELVEAFTWDWLGLQNALDMAPDPARFPEYHGARLDQAARTETRTFFHHALRANRPLAELLTADYTFVNADLARLYGLAGVHTTARFERVDLPAGLERGGLLGQAAVLTASANGVDTSPVTRGVWVLEHLLGAPPAPPPPDVPVPEPDARGTRSIREVLARHGSEESCRSCHASIDPLGLALESFDAIGRWRALYETGAPVETAGRMPDGTPIAGSGDLRAALVRELPLVTRHLVRELVVRAAGRRVSPADQAEVERIVAAAARPGFGLRDLVLAVVESPLFRER